MLPPPTSALWLASCMAALLIHSESQSGPPDPIHPGLPCDPHRCECGKLDLSQFKGRVYDTPPDAHGMRVRFKMCENLTTAELPTGCQGDAEWLQAPSSVFYNQSNSLDCDQIGSFGPCSEPVDGQPKQCGMTFNDSRSDGGELLVTWQLEYGCINTFRVRLSAGTDAAPEIVAHDPNSCYWQTHWAGFHIPYAPPAPPLPNQSSTPLSVVMCIVILVALGGVLGGYVLWWRTRRGNSEQLLAEPSSVAYTRDEGLGAE